MITIGLIGGFILTTFLIFIVIASNDYGNEIDERNRKSEANNGTIEFNEPRI